MKINAVIFDMDGVILNSEPLHYAIETKIFKEAKIPISKEEHNALKGYSDKDLWRIVCNKYKCKFSPEELSNLNRKYIKESFSKAALKEYDGLSNLLKFLKNQQIKIALASGSPADLVQLVLKKLNIKPFFSYALSADDVAKAKPEPEIYLKAVNLLKTDITDCLVIEDSKNGMNAALAANIKCWIYNPENLEESWHKQADKIFTSHSAIHKYLLEYTF